MAKSAQPTTTSSSSSSVDGKALFYMALLALQFGVQPILVHKYTSKEATKSTVILMQEVIKFGLALSMLLLSSGGSLAKAREAVKGTTRIHRKNLFSEPCTFLPT